MSILLGLLVGFWIGPILIDSVFGGLFEPRKKPKGVPEAFRFADKARGGGGQVNWDKPRTDMVASTLKVLYWVGVYIAFAYLVIHIFDWLGL